LLALTPACVAWIAEGRAASHDWLAGALSRTLSPKEQRQLHAALALLRRAVDA
jgi:hypothetical protein